MLTTIILFFALLTTVIMLYCYLSCLINLFKDKYDGYDEFEFGLLVISCLLWAWFYYLTTH